MDYKCSVCNKTWSSKTPPKQSPCCKSPKFLQRAEPSTEPLAVPKSERDLTPEYLDLLQVTHARTYGTDSGDTKVIGTLADGKGEVSSSVLSRVIKIVKLLNQELGFTKSRIAEIEKLVKLLKSKPSERLYRDTTKAEADDYPKTKRFKQGENSMDKYKWFFWDLKYVPREGEGFPSRFIIDVPEGTIDAIKKLAVQQESKMKQQSALLTRDRTLPGGLKSETNEPGTFAVHEDVLQIFSEKIVKACRSETKKK